MDVRRGGRVNWLSLYLLFGLLNIKVSSAFIAGSILILVHNSMFRSMLFIEKLPKFQEMLTEWSESANHWILLIPIRHRFFTLCACMRSFNQHRIEYTFHSIIIDMHWLSPSQLQAYFDIELNRIPLEANCYQIYFSIAIAKGNIYLLYIKFAISFSFVTRLKMNEVDNLDYFEQ